MKILRKIYLLNNSSNFLSNTLLNSLYLLLFNENISSSIFSFSLKSICLIIELISSKLSSLFLFFSLIFLALSNKFLSSKVISLKLLF